MTNKRVLLVDDEPHVIRIMKRVLERGGCAVEQAANGEQAIQCLKNVQPDIVITDIDMPKMNGRELCAWIVEHLPQRQFPIVVLTSRSESEHRDWSSAIENLNFMEKPVSMRALSSLIENLDSDGLGQQP